MEGTATQEHRQQPDSLLGPLELGMQELEAMDAPGFWTGFGIGATIAIGLTAIGAT